MTCQEVRENLSAYLQQKLSTQESASIKQHLGECAICANELDILKQADIALEHFPSIEPSSSFNARLFARIDELETRGGKKWFSWGRIRLVDRYAWSLVVLLITTVGVWIGIRHQQYRELSSLQKVIEVQDRYLGSSKEKGNNRSEPSVQTKELTGTRISQGQKATETPMGKDEEIPEEDKALLENLELLRQSGKLFRDMTPEQQERLRKFQRRWQNLPPERRQHIIQRLHRLQNLPPQEKERALKAMPFWQKLDPDERQSFQDFLERLPQTK